MGYIIDFNAGIDCVKNIYGVIFDGSNKTGTRTYISKYLDFEPSNLTTAGRDDFSCLKTSPFHIKECITKYNSSTGKQEILAYEGDSNWNQALQDSDHNRMIEFPKFYYKRPSKWEWQVSSYQHTGFKPSPLHYRNGVMHDYAYIAKYHANSNFKSQSGQSIWTQTTTNYNSTVSSFASQGLYNWDYALWCTLSMLMIIKYNNVDIQRVIGLGYSLESAPATTGLADSIKGKDGYTSINKMDSGSIVCMGIENFYSNSNKMIIGAIKTTDKFYINTNIDSISQYMVPNLNGYSVCSTNIFNGITDLGYITDIAYDSTFDWAIYPTSGTNSTYSGLEAWQRDYGNYVGDLYWSNTANTNHILTLGGHYGTGFAAGLFYLGAYLTTTNITHSDRDYISTASFFLS